MSNSRFSFNGSFANSNEYQDFNSISDSSSNSIDSFNSFDIINFSSYNNSESNLKDLGDEICNNLKNLLNKNNSDTILSLTKCFICLSPSINPLSCPKCNNFACQDCFKKYFGYHTLKKCPLCKQNIKIGELYKNEVLIEIENILSKDETSSKKLIDLKYVFNKKKLKLINKENKLNDIINKLLEYEEKIINYRKEYEIFFLKCKEIIDKTLDEYERKIREVFNILFPNIEDNEVQKKINNKNKINSNNINNTEEKIKSVINGILSFERKSFNDKNKKNFKEEIDTFFQIAYILSKKYKKEVLKFISRPIFIIPNISYCSIGFINLEKKHFKHNIKKKGYNEYLGDFVIQYKLEKDNEYCYLCELNFSLKNKKNTNYFLIQKKIIDDKCIEIYPMKLENDDEKESLYESTINCDEFKNKEIKEITMEIKLQVFSINNNY